MANDLVIVERELKSRLPIFQQVLPRGVAPERLMRTVIISCEKTPKLLECGPQSIINAATTAAVLGLECDGVTGQGFLVPYARVATFQIGYKGFNTIGARSGLTISAGAVREDDEFDYMLGSGGFVKHKPLLTGSKYQRKIVAVWAVAECRDRPNILVVLPIDDVLATKAKSQGAKKPDSPWNDPNVGFEAMAEKTARRRLARSMPLNVSPTYHRAAALEDQYDMGRAANLGIDGELRIVGEESLAPGPVSQGIIRDTQPADLKSPANPSKPRFPSSFTKLADFMTYSRQLLAGASIEMAAAWQEHFAAKLEEMEESSRADVSNAAAVLFVDAISVGIRHAKDGDAITDMMQNEAVRKRVGWLLERHKDEHARLFELANGRRKALAGSSGDLL